jgi:hypothetical protein
MTAILNTLRQYLQVRRMDPHLPHCCSRPAPAPLLTLLLSRKGLQKGSPAGSILLAFHKVKLQSVHTLLCSMLRAMSPGSLLPIVARFCYVCNCEDRLLDKDGLCKQCRSLLSSDRFRSFLACMQDGVVRENTPYRYHGLASLINITRKKEQTILMFCTRRINDARKLLRHEGVIDLHHQVLFAMSIGNIPRVDCILRVASDRHMSVTAILEMVRKAGQGIYRPKGFKEEEDLQTLLFLHLGGKRVAEMAHHMFGIPAPSTVRCRTMIPPLICSASYPLEDELVNNLKAVFEDLLPVLAAQRRIHIVLMLDEIAQEKRPQWCDRTNKILGCCREHTKQRCMEFNSVADAELLLQDVARGDVHLAHEVSHQLSHATAHIDVVSFPRPPLVPLASSAQTPDYIVQNLFLFPGAVRRRLQKTMQFLYRQP